MKKPLIMLAVFALLVAAFAPMAHAEAETATHCVPPSNPSAASRFPCPPGWTPKPGNPPTRPPTRPPANPPTQPPAQPPTQPPAQPPAVTRPVTSAESQLVSLINQERQKAGLQPLRVNSQLTQAARAKSQDFINKNYFSHTSPTYGSVPQMLRKFGIPFQGAAENIAIDRSAQGAHANFMRSPSHKANILNPRMTQVGVGVVAKGTSLYITQLFIYP